MSTPALMETPKGPADKYCQFAKGWCNKTCHTCILWRPMDVVRKDEKGVTYKSQEWDCALAWGNFTSGVMNSKLEALYKISEGMRNEYAAFRQSVVACIAGIAGVRRQLPPPVEPAVALTAEPVLAIEPPKEAPDGKVNRDDQP